MFYSARFCKCEWKKIWNSKKVKRLEVGSMYVCECSVCGRVLDVDCGFVYVRSCLTHSRHFAWLHSNSKRHYLPAAHILILWNGYWSALYAASVSSWTQTIHSPNTCLVMMIIIMCGYELLVSLSLKRCIFVWRVLDIASVSCLNHLWVRRGRSGFGTLVDECALWDKSSVWWLERCIVT